MTEVSTINAMASMRITYPEQHTKAPVSNPEIFKLRHYRKVDVIHRDLPTVVKHAQMVLGDVTPVFHPAMARVLG
jgi:hypothetical protein